MHQLSKRATQNPFRKNKGKVVKAAFHPSKPFFFVATQNSVRIYNLAKQELAKKLISGAAVITSLAVHPSGDHVIIGSEVRFIPSCMKIGRKALHRAFQVLLSRPRS